MLPRRRRRDVWDICDFCVHYAFNGDEDGAYTGDGRCEHPEHPRPSEPYSSCKDFQREDL